ncbi:NDP-hexose 2,3-dehydratase family protein [Kitasatospora sp. NPDC056800]|uniref:NDP-hexose 2,3-dehydratase family protein n=1 Tax=Kitasatospora sp. NPDC056800 TaxID=3345948 RepID=UPI0036A0C28D
MSTIGTVRGGIGTRLPALTRRPAAAPGRGGPGASADEIAHWLSARVRADRFRVERIPFDRLRGWSFAPDTGDLVHDSGRFFSIQGVEVETADGPVPTWRQPIIDQPEVGILGIIAKDFGGVRHYLMQAKMEPGNPNIVQLSPTVQATHSNYTGVHKGAPVAYLEYFLDPSRGRPVADVLQSEHGDWFNRKFNRNTIVLVDEEVPVAENFRWLTLDRIAALLHRDNLVNMDARTVLSCLPLPASGASGLISVEHIEGWLAAERARRSLRVRRVPLRETGGWVRTAHAIRRVPDRHFRVVAVAVEAGSREVAQWTQPLVEPVRLGLSAFVLRYFSGVPHLLARAGVEVGFQEIAELAPTVQCTPEHHRGRPRGPRHHFLDVVENAAPSRVRYSALHSEEGGRFLNAVSRYAIVEADGAQAPSQPPPGYCWVTPGQLSALVTRGGRVNVQARTLLSALTTRAVRL